MFARDVLDVPLKRKKARTYFVNSMSDLFHDDVPLEFIKKVFEVMNTTPQHTYQILTKRADRLESCIPHVNWTKNIWVGVSVENEKYAGRIGTLRKVPAAVRFIMFEPLIGSVKKLDLNGISWAIVGGESGPHYRVMDIEWVRSIRDECVKSHVPFVFKQYAGKDPEKLGRLLDGREWDERPIVE